MAVKKKNVNFDESAEKEEKGRKINLPRPDEIKAYLDQYVIGQDEAKIALSVAVYNHYKRIFNNKGVINKNGTVVRNTDVTIDKSNCLLLGPTGSGKTYMLKKIAELLNVPFTIADANTMTQSGYVGADVEDCIVGLLRACDYDIEATELGIVVLDEIDKIRKVSAGQSITRDVGGEGTQQALLKMLEGSTVGVPPAGGRRHPEQQLLYVDTTNILFIGLGAFVGLDTIIERRTQDKSIGFTVKSTKEEDYNPLNYVTQQDLRDYGLIPEFVGRFPIITHVDKLDKEALKNILKEPKNSLVKQYTELLAMDGIRLSFTDEAIDEIASLAFKLETGARALRSVVEAVMTDVMFNAPKMFDEGVRDYVLTSDYVISKTKKRFSNFKNAA